MQRTLNNIPRKEAQERYVSSLGKIILLDQSPAYKTCVVFVRFLKIINIGNHHHCFNSWPNRENSEYAFLFFKFI